VEVETVVLRSRNEMLHGLAPEQQAHLCELLQTIKASLAAALEVDRAEAQALRGADADAGA